MAVSGNGPRRLRIWQAGGLTALVVTIVVVSLGASTLFGGSEPPSPPVSQGEISGPAQPQVREISVKSKLVFPHRAELTFDTAGEIGEVLVKEGDRVTEGQPLARLDQVAVTTLEEAVAQARLDLDEAEEALDETKEEFVTLPLERADLDEKIAKATKELQDAQEKLEDFPRDYHQDLARAIKAEADASATLDTSQDALNDFQRDYDKDLATARDKKADAEVALDQATEDYEDFLLDEGNDLDKAQTKANDALKAVAIAEDTLAVYRRTLGLFTPFGFEEDGRDDPGDELRRLEAEQDLANSNLALANDDLAKDLLGPDQLKLQDLEAALELARATLAEKDQDLIEELEGPDQLSLAQRQAAVEVNQAKLVQAQIDLAEEVAGPDQAELELREKDVAKKLEKLADLIDDPDPFEVQLREAEISTAQAKLDDALKDLAGSVVRAPFAGVISLVNVEVEDVVNKESRVMELIDPTIVRVDGLVDATEIDFVREEAKARVIIESVAGPGLEGVVVAVAKNPRTERGVVTYPIKIQVEVPPGIEVPVKPSSVSSVVFVGS